MEEESKSGGWWQTLPGILTAVAAIITAVAGLIIALHQTGILGGGGKPTQTEQGSPSKGKVEQPRPEAKPTETEEKPRPAAEPAAEQGAAPDLFVSEFSLNPSPPVQGRPVSVRIGVYNKGKAASGPFTVQWWPGENFPAAACTWRIDGLAARGGRILNGTYEGYQSWYAKVVTKSVVDSSGKVPESNEANNVYRQTIRVARP